MPRAAAPGGFVYHARPSIPTEADLATVDDAARLLERAYRRFEELRPAHAEWLNTVRTLRWRGRTSRW